MLLRFFDEYGFVVMSTHDRFPVVDERGERTEERHTRSHWKGKSFSQLDYISCSRDVDGIRMIVSRQKMISSDHKYLICKLSFDKL